MECVGGLCGSVYLDQAFEKNIIVIVGQDQWNQLKPRSKQRMMHEFEISIKRVYAGDDREFEIELQDVKDDPSVGIEDETITVKHSVKDISNLTCKTDDSNSTTLQTIFDHVIGKIERLVEKQIDEVSDTGNNVKVSRRNTVSLCIAE